ncbi:hypothetical protein P8452_25707 [Trifolium repens]|nr:hypothetical protein P8452_25707 [Trifolium repens]
MERREKRSYKTSVPQFEGWENKPKGVPTDYSMVFNQARENKKNHKTDVLEVRRLSVGNDQRVASNTTNHRHGHGRGRGSTHGSGHNHPNGIQDPPVMKRPYKMSVPQFGGWDNKPKGVPTDYSLVFYQARENKKNLNTYLTRRDSIRNDRFAKNAATNHHRHGGHGHYTRCSRNNEHDHGHHQDSPVMGKRNVLSYMNWCNCKP